MATRTRQAAPAKPDTRALFVRVPNDLHRKLKILAAREQISLQDLVFDALCVYLFEADKRQGSRRRAAGPRRGHHGTA